MKRKALMFCIFIYLSFFTTSLFAENDILGWGKAKWGMTHSQIAKIYDLEDWLKDAETPTCHKKEFVDIQGYLFSVTFRFDKRSPSGKLIEVDLCGYEKRREEFGSVLGLLVGKYGNPNTFKVDSLGDRTCLWLRPSGQIKFETSSFTWPDKTTTTCFIYYIAVISDSDKL
jgi:hypothetical protein